MAVAVGKALGADPVILTALAMQAELGLKLGADYVINIRNENRCRR